MGVDDIDLLIEHRRRRRYPAFWDAFEFWATMTVAAIGMVSVAVIGWSLAAVMTR